VNYVDRTYDAIVRDLLTTLTGGTVDERVTVPALAGEGVPIVLPKLRNRPVRRVSHLVGRLRDAPADAPPFRFTEADFELVDTDGQGSDAIAFRARGRKPEPGSELSVNYYPVHADPVPVDDINVGSVVRTMLETVGRELAVEYLLLQRVYDSAFVDTATDSSLDNVVALVGVRRLPAGFPVVKLRISRSPGTGRVTVPAGTGVVDAAGSRYLTVAEVALEPGEPSRDVLAAGESAATPLVAAGAFTQFEVLVAGIGEVTNPEPARALATSETDDELRRRAHGSLHGRVRGTVDALKFSVGSVPGVKGIELQEAPNGVWGEVALSVAYADPEHDDVEAAVQRIIDEVRPAGVRVLHGSAARVRVDADVALTLAGAGVAGAELTELRESAEQRLTELLRAVAPGGAVRAAQVSAALLRDPRIVDAAVSLRPAGRSPGSELSLQQGEVLELGTITFAEPQVEAPAEPVPTTATVDAVLPAHLLPGVTLGSASTAIGTVFDSHLGSRSAERPLTVDGLVAALRDDSRYVLVRADIQVVVRSGERFLQLTDGVGTYAPPAGERLERGEMTVEPREGSV
jgi:uncharacterized phage protein gp47/JayE